LSGAFGNPSSIHAEGLRAKAALEEARERVADGLGCRPSEVVFTSGGSESNNLAIRGLVEARGRGHVITSAVEHPAVLEVVLALEIEGRISLTVVGVDEYGRVDPQAVAAAFRDDTVLVSLMLANNEVGTLQPVREVAAMCRERGVTLHTDAAQAVGKVEVDVGDLGVDLLSVAGHKLYAPKGIGALVIRNGVRLEPQIRGAGHENGRRAGTENVLLAVGLGTACELAMQEVAVEQERLSALRNRLVAALQGGSRDLVEHGHPVERLPNTASVAIPGCVADELLASLSDDLAASAGAACHAGAATVSHVLQAMGVDPDLAAATIRLSVGRFSSEEEIDRAAGLILAAARDQNGN
jgi:cysteine desulfurase